MIVDVSQKPRYIEFISELTGTKAFGNCKTIAFIDGSKLMVTLFNKLDERNIEISVATSSSKMCSKRILKIVFGYPFVQLGLNRVTATINEANEKSLSLVKRLGFQLEGELKQYYDNGNTAMIYGLTKDNCRWLK